jgi:hypothetical protein
MNREKHRQRKSKPGPELDWICPTTRLACREIETEARSQVEKSAENRHAHNGKNSDLGREQVNKKQGNFLKISNKIIMNLYISPLSLPRMIIRMKITSWHTSLNKKSK